MRAVQLGLFLPSYRLMFGGRVTWVCFATNFFFLYVNWVKLLSSICQIRKHFE